MTYDEDDLNEANVEDRIVGEFMTELQEADVPFEYIEALEGLIDQEDFGGADAILAEVESRVLDDAS